MDLPEDVAEYLTQHPEATSVVTRAVRRVKEGRESTIAALRSVGINVTEEGMAYWRDRLKPLTDEDRAANRQWIAAIRAGRTPAEEAR